MVVAVSEFKVRYETVLEGFIRMPTGRAASIQLVVGGSTPLGWHLSRVKG